MTRDRAKYSGVLAFLTALAVVSCHPLDEGDGETPPPIGSIVGVWTITEIVPPGLDPRCAAPPSPYLLYVAQNGNVITAQTGLSTDPNVGSNGAQFVGTLNGSTLAIQGNNPGTVVGSTLQTARVATVAGGCDALIEGGRTMLYTDPGFSCNGFLSFTATRSIGSGCAGTLAATAVAETGTLHSTAGTAQAVTRPAEVSGTITTAEEDWYSFTLPAGNTPVTILLNGPAAPANIDLFLTDDAGMALVPATQSTSGSSREAVARVLAVPGPDPATYKVRVVATGLASPVSYTLLIQ